MKKRNRVRLPEQSAPDDSGIPKQLPRVPDAITDVCSEAATILGRTRKPDLQPNADSTPAVQPEDSTGDVCKAAARLIANRRLEERADRKNPPGSGHLLYVRGGLNVRGPEVPGPHFRKIPYSLTPEFAGLLKAVSAEASSSILTLANNADANARVEAVKELAKLPDRSKGVIGSLIFALDDESLIVRCTAAKALGSIGPAAHEAAPILFDLIKESGPPTGDAPGRATIYCESLIDLLNIDIKPYKMYRLLRKSQDFVALAEELRIQGIGVIPKGEPTPPNTKTATEVRRELLDALSATVPKDASYEEQIAHREALKHAFNQKLAVDHGDSLKAELRRRPHETYQDKKELVKWVNSELRRLGLAFKSPKTGQAATFVARHGNHPGIGKFQIVSVEPDGSEKTFNTPDLDTLLSSLELMDAPSRREPLSEWRERVTRDRDRDEAKRG